MSQKTCVSASIGYDFISRHMSRALIGLLEFFNNPLKYKLQREGSLVYKAMEKNGKKNEILNFEFDFVNPFDRVEEVKVEKLGGEGFELVLPFPVEVNGTEF